ncbi:hypothetical protein DPMN_186938 [Dreissena polymorpha]|uniref:Uncharacterized protein n=1 Tax=Dreissena polymorpha TaxID=45954 RepID=A0A9D4IA05_DREPO|nr:hypothetical protein DPMN_186938 [Dreissena polymorpha]
MRKEKEDERIKKALANSEDPDETPHDAASHRVLFAIDLRAASYKNESYAIAASAAKRNQKLPYPLLHHGRLRRQRIF